MRLKALFIAAILGIAVVSGVIQALSSPRDRAREEEGESLPPQTHR